MFNNSFKKYLPCNCFTNNLGFNCFQIRYDDDDEDEGPQPDATLEQGVPLPVRMQGSFPPELASTPLEDIDTFYTNKLVWSLV